MRWARDSTSRSQGLPRQLWLVPGRQLGRGRYGGQLGRGRYGGSCGSTSTEGQRDRGTGSLAHGELPSRGDTRLCRTDGSCQPGQCPHCLLQVRLLLLQSWGPQQRCRDEEDEEGDKQSPRQGRWLLGESGGLAGIFTQAQSSRSELAGRKGEVRRH